VTKREFCSAISGSSGETLAATASRVDHWILVEYRGAWAHDAVEGSLLSPELKEHLRRQLAAVRHGRLLFVKRPARRPQSGSRVFLASSRPGAERLLGLELDELDGLLELDLAPVLAGADTDAEQLEGPLYLVCTHGKHDRCCALHGRPLYDALRHDVDPARVWQSTHVGGDRFAGNVVVLPHGLYYGRVGPDEAGRVLAATAAGEVDLALYRGRSAYSFAVQAAEHGLRTSTGLSGLEDLALVGAWREGDGQARVRFRTPDSAVHELHVAESVARQRTYLTCDSANPRRARHWRVTAHDVVSR